MQILLAPDKFKRSLSASQACTAIEQGLRDGWPHTLPCPGFIHHPIADGGEGTTEAVVTALGGRWLDLDSQDAHGRRIRTRYGWIDELPGHQHDSPDQTSGLTAPVAVVEMSAASGLDLVSDLPLDPWRASTSGTGQMLRHAAERGAGSIFLGIGGSATNDAGCAMAAALGYQWLDAAGKPIPIDELPARLLEALAIDDSGVVPLPPLLVAVDVTNPLLGANGATRIYGPQKGIPPADIERHEARLAHIARLVRHLRPEIPGDAIDQPGSGAAGGLGFTLRHLLGASLMPGFDLIARLTSIEQAIATADLVITGEGRFDHQSLNGKGPAGVARIARRHGKPAIAMCGLLDQDAAAAAGFAAAWQAKPDDLSTSEAIARAAELLRECARQNSPLLPSLIAAS